MGAARRQVCGGLCAQVLLRRREHADAVRDRWRSPGAAAPGFLILTITYVPS